MGVRVFEFGDYKLDCARFELFRAGRSLKLERKPMELLVLLAEKNGHLVTRTEIAERLWDRAVFVDTEHGINTAVRKIREALRDDPVQSRFVQTVTGKGYRFAAAVVEVRPVEDVVTGVAVADAVAAVAAADRVELDDGADLGIRRRKRWWWGGLGAAAALGLVALAMYRHATALPRISSVAVLPIDNFSGDPAQNYYADGITDELITMLAKNSTLRVVSRTSVMQYKGVHRPLRDIARELGVDGVLEG